MTMRKLSLLIATALLLTPAASAKDGDGRVERSGSCSGASNWELTVKPDDGRLEVEFDVDQNRNGVQWHVVLKLNGDKVRQGTRTTQPRAARSLSTSGSRTPLVRTRLSRRPRAPAASAVVAS